MRVLLVDTSPPVRTALAGALTRVGLHVATESSATEALELMLSIEFDAVVTDYHTQPRSGVWLLQRVAQINPFTLRVLITDDPMLDLNRLAGRGICHGHLRRPFPPQALVSMMLGCPTLEISEDYTPIG